MLPALIFVTGTITVDVHSAHLRENGVYVQHVDSPATLGYGILGFGGPAQYTVQDGKSGCTGHYGNAASSVRTSVYLTRDAQENFHGLMMPAQLLGGADNSGHTCGMGFSAILQRGLAAPPRVPQAGMVAHWKFDLFNVPDALVGSEFTRDWHVDLTFTDKERTGRK